MPLLNYDLLRVIYKSQVKIVDDLVILVGLPPLIMLFRVMQLKNKISPRLGRRQEGEFIAIGESYLSLQAGFCHKPCVNSTTCVGCLFIKEKTL